MAATVILTKPNVTDTLGTTSGASNVHVLEFAPGTRLVTVEGSVAFYYQVDSALDDDATAGSLDGFFGPVPALTPTDIDIPDDLAVGTRRIAFVSVTAAVEIRFHSKS